jgi:hypothetical protein
MLAREEFRVERSNPAWQALTRQFESPVNVEVLTRLSP